MLICQADMSDYQGILSIHRKYHTNYIKPEDRPDGFVTTNFTEEQLEKLIVKERGVTIAKDGEGTVLAYAMAAPWEFWAPWPLFTCMIEKLPEFSLDGRPITVENSYQYGPICIDRSVRGTGLFEKVFCASLASMADRWPIMATFINQINGRSYAAHTRKVPMTTAGTFQFNQNDYYLMACPTSLAQTISRNTSSFSLL